MREESPKRLPSVAYALGLGVAIAVVMVVDCFSGGASLRHFAGWVASGIFLTGALVSAVRGETVLPASEAGATPKLAALGLALICIGALLGAFAGILFLAFGAFALIFVYLFPFAAPAALLALFLGVGLVEIARARTAIHDRSADGSLLVALFAASGLLFILDASIGLDGVFSLFARRQELGVPLGTYLLLTVTNIYFYLELVRLLTGVILAAAAVSILRKDLNRARLLGFLGVFLGLSFVLLSQFEGIGNDAPLRWRASYGDILVPLPWVFGGIGLHRYLRDRKGG